MNLVKSLKHGRSADKPLKGRRRRSINRSKGEAEIFIAKFKKTTTEEVNNEEKNNGEEEEEEQSNYDNKVNEEK